MKTFKTTSIILLILLGIIFNWNCSDEQIQNNHQDKPEQYDGPNPKVELVIDEYVKVTPSGTPPYYTYINVAAFSCLNPVNNGAGNYCTDSFTTPDSIRTISGVLYEKQHFRVTKSSLFHCGTSNCNLAWFIQGVLNENLPVTVGSVCGSEYSCLPGIKYCGSTYDQDEPASIYSGTSYDVGYGGQCF